MIRYERGDERRGYVTVEQIRPGDVVAVDSPPHGRVPALRGWAAEREVTDGRQIPGRICAYRVGDMRDCVAYPDTTTWSTEQPATGGAR